MNSILAWEKTVKISLGEIYPTRKMSNPNPIAIFKIRSIITLLATIFSNDLINDSVVNNLCPFFDQNT